MQLHLPSQTSSAASMAGFFSRSVSKLKALALLGTIGLISLSSSVHAQTYWNASVSGTGTVATGGAWTTAANWSGGVAPTSTSDVVFNTVGLNGAETITAIGAAQGVTFNNTGLTTLSGGNLKLGSDGLTINLGAGVALGTSVSLEASQTWTQASTNGSIQFTGGFTADSSVTNAITLTINNTASGAFDWKSAFKDNSATGTVAVVFNLTAGGITLESATAASTNTGGDTIQAGTVTLKSGANPFGNGTLTFGTGTTATNALFINSAGTYNFSNSSVVLMAGDTTTIDNNQSAAIVTFSGVISGSGTLTIGSSASSAGVILTGTNTYSGGTNLNSGPLYVNNASALGTGALTVAGGVLDNSSGAAETLTTNNAIILNNNLSFAGSNSLNMGTGNVALGGTSRTITTTSGTSTLTLGGVISGNTAAIGLTKAGAGTLALAGANTYTGTTTVSAGNLQLLNAAAISTGAVNVTGATSVISGTGGAAGLVTVSGGAIVAPGVNAGSTNFGSAGTIRLGGTNGLNLSNATLTFDLASLASGTSDKITTSALTLGTLTFDISGLSGTLQTGTFYDLIDSDSAVTTFNPANINTVFVGTFDTTYTAVYSMNGNDLQVEFTAAVPEPGTWALMLGGLGLLVGYQRVRRSRNS